jgi:hypothetical protein
MYSPLSPLSKSILHDLKSNSGLQYLFLSFILFFLLMNKPDSFARTTTKACDSSPADRPSIQYALVIDAGSTGSRIHVVTTTKYSTDLITVKAPNQHSKTKSLFNKNLDFPHLNLCRLLNL